jgi:hypothetical protein
VTTTVGSAKKVVLPAVLVATPCGVAHSLPPVVLAVEEELRSRLAEMPAASVVVGVAPETRQLMVVPVVLTEPHWAPNALRRTAATGAALKGSVSDRD